MSKRNEKAREIVERIVHLDFRTEVDTDKAVQIVRRALREAERNGWQPIDTAPKAVKCWVHFPRGGNVLGSNYPTQCAAIFEDGVWVAANGCTYDFDDASLWHELPIAPSDDATDY